MAARIERYDDSARLLPALAALGQSRQRQSRAALREHSHEAYEFCLVTGGVVRWQVEGRSVDVGPDGCFLTKPGERHGSLRSVLEPCVLSWLQVDTRRLARAALARRLRRAPMLAARGASALVPLIEAMLRECRAPRSDSAILLDGLLSEFLVRFLRALESPDAAPAPLPKELLRAEAQIAASAGRLSVGAIAAHCGLSRSRLHQLFRAHRHCSPSYLITEARLARARELLRDPRRAIIAIAMELEFSSAQHFANAFRRHCGCSPSAWRADAFSARK
jgi:AraC-like DNA-binding protein